MIGLQELINRSLQIFRQRGLGYTFHIGTKAAYFWLDRTFRPKLWDLNLFFYRYIKPNKEFNFRGRKYHYFYHSFNQTWSTERAVEIPIIWDLVRKENPQRVLELGNVLHHYLPAKHDVLDKYEKGSAVINEDVVSYKAKKKYDLIVSISTLEHVGWDERVKEPGKTLRGIENLQKLLSSRGKIVFTFPPNYNHYLDKFLAQGKIPYSDLTCLKRISWDNRWVETDYQDIIKLKYDSPFPRGNGLFVVTLSNDNA